jgi:hypothetical protein
VSAAAKTMGVNSATVMGAMAAFPARTRYAVHSSFRSYCEEVSLIFDTVGY